MHDLLGINTFWTVLSKQVGNTGHILAYPFHPAYAQCCEVWASLFPFLHSVHDTVASSEACTSVHINLSQAGVHQQSLLGLPQSSDSMRDARATSKARFMFSEEKQPVLVSCGAF